MLTVEEKNARRREAYQRNAEKYKARTAAWRAAHPEYVKVQNDRYYEENKEKCNELSKAYQSSPNGKASLKQSREKSKDKNAKRSRIWRINHPGATTKQQQAWKEKNPEKYRLSNANKYGFRKQLGAANWKLSADELAGFMSSQLGCCYYCKIELTGNYHLEHKTPLSKGGAHLLDNLCLACPKCNLIKHNKTEVEFRNYLDKER